MSEREDILGGRFADVAAERPGWLPAGIGEPPGTAAGVVVAACRRRTGAQRRPPFDSRGEAS